MMSSLLVVKRDDFCLMLKNNLLMTLVTEGNSSFTDETNVVDDRFCRICQQCGSLEDDLNPVFKNECTVCTDDWSICSPCHASLITGKCPLCTEDYAPLILHEVPGPSLHELGNAAVTDELKAMLIYKHLILRRVLRNSNVAVLDVANQKMNFSIPKYVEEDGIEFSCLTICVPVEAIRSNFGHGGEFVFNATVWDVIEELLQSNDEENMDKEFTKPARVSAEWLLQLTGDPSNRIYTMLDEQQWAENLDPLKCADSIRSIMENIVRRDNSHVPKLSGDRTYNFLIHSAY